MTQLYQALRVCERFRQTPAWWDALDAAEQALLLEYERMRWDEDRAMRHGRKEQDPDA